MTEKSGTARKDELIIFEEEMKRMSSDSSIKEENEYIAELFRQTENDGLTDGYQTQKKTVMNPMHFEVYDDRKRKTLYVIPLHHKVLAVAVVNDPDSYNDMREWAVYIGPVDGKNHREECKSVADFGSKISRKLAFVIFEFLADDSTLRYRS